MKRIQSLALPLAALAMLGACGPTPEERFARARESYAEHLFNNARLDLTSALKEQPGDAAMLELLARSHIELGDGEAALAALGKLAALGVMPADGAILLGEAELQRGRFEEALQRVADDESAGAWRVRALAHVKLGDDDAAAEAFAKGRQAKGKRAPLLAENARFELRRGDLAAARKLVDQALEEDGGVLEAQLASAQLLSAQGRLGEALAVYEKAALQYPESRSATVGRIAALGELGRVNDMKPLLEEAVARSGDEPSLAYLEARMAAADGDWKKVRTLIQPIESSFDDLPEARLLYGQALAAVGQHEQAMAHLRTYLRGSPGHRLARRLMAESQLAAGEARAAYATMAPLAASPQATREELGIMAKAAKAAGLPQAKQLAKRARFPSPEALGADLAEADTALRSEDWKSAAAAYRRVLAATKGNALVFNNLAFAEMQLGNDAAALKLALQALALEPRNPSVMDTAGMLLVKTGEDRSRGVKLLEQAAALAPGNANIARHLADVRRG